MKLTRKMTKYLEQSRVNFSSTCLFSNNDVFSSDFNLYVMFTEVSRMSTASF